jgi:hypothetical protein
MPNLDFRGLFEDEPVTADPTQPPTVPEELRHKWLYYAPITSPEREYQLMAQASAWAWAQREPELQARADAEMEACCEVLRENHLLSDLTIERLRAARRPSPPTLREQALAALEHEVRGDYSTTKGTKNDGFRVVTDTTIALIREALKETPNG